MTPSETTSCQACGHQPWAADRFCSACGSRLGERSTGTGADGSDLAGSKLKDAVAPDSPVDHVVELETVAASGSKPLAAARGAESWRRIGSIAILLVVLLVGWRLLSGTDASDGDDGGSISEAASSEREADDREDQSPPDEGDDVDPFDGKIRGATVTAATPAPTAVAEPYGFWPEPRHLREGFDSSTSFEQNNPPERQAALQALYAPVPVANLDVGAGSLAIDASGGPVLIDLVSGDVSALAGRNQLLPAGAISLSPAGVVMRFADPALFGGVNEAAGVVLPWDGGSPIELVALGWQTADRAGNQLLSFSGSPSQARYLQTDLSSGRTVSTTIAVTDPTARITRSGEIVFAAGADVIAADVLTAEVELTATGPRAEDVSHRALARGELVETVGGFMVIDCEGYPACQLQLFDDRFEPGASQSIDGRDPVRSSSPPTAPDMPDGCRRPRTPTTGRSISSSTVDPTIGRCPTCLLFSKTSPLASPRSLLMSPGLRMAAGCSSATPRTGASTTSAWSAVGSSISICRRWPLSRSLPQRTVQLRHDSRR